MPARKQTEEEKRYRKFFSLMTTKQMYVLGINFEHVLYPNEYWNLWPAGDMFFSQNPMDIANKAWVLLNRIKEDGWIENLKHDGIGVFTYDSVAGAKEMLKALKDKNLCRAEEARALAEQAKEDYAELNDGSEWLANAQLHEVESD